MKRGVARPDGVAVFQLFPLHLAVVDRSAVGAVLVDDVVHPVLFLDPEVKPRYLRIVDLCAGVIVAAGIIEDDFILRKDSDSFRRVLATKVLGCIHVDLATKEEPLDFFLAFSDCNRSLACVDAVIKSS